MYAWCVVECVHGVWLSMCLFAHVREKCKG